VGRDQRVAELGNRVVQVVAVVSRTALVPVERRQRAPTLRLSLFASRQFNAINATTVLFYGALGAASYLLVLQCELRLGYSATQAGAVLILESAVFLVVSPLSGALVSRVGPRWLMTAGILAVAAAFSVALRGSPRRELCSDDSACQRAVGPRSRVGRDSP
jgi:predicted MFS family arabinose efflux permease